MVGKLISIMNTLFTLTFYKLNRNFLVLLILFLFTKAECQTKRKFKVHTIAFYNVENLFDTINDPNKNDEASPMMELKSGRKEIYLKKVQNMASAISKIGEKTSRNSPAIVGLSEVENRTVIEDLINDASLKTKNYGIVHYDSPDERGIDVALIYQKALFQPTNTSSHELKLSRRSSGRPDYTRDVLLVSGYLENDLIHILVNHWPSRSGGEARSRSKREAAAALNRNLIDSLQNINPKYKIFVMGDLNDNPTNSSLKKFLKTSGNKSTVEYKGLFNPMEIFFKKGLGSNAYRDAWSLFDQIIVSKSLLGNDYSSFKFYKAGIFNEQFLITKKGQYKGYPFRSFSWGGFTDGYSDHFPVFIHLIKEIN